MFALHENDRLQQSMATLYAGSAIAATMVGDLVSFFVLWEVTALSSVFLIWASRNSEAMAAGVRYLAIQVGSGVILLIGALIHINATGSLAFTEIGLDSPGGAIMLFGVGIKAAFPFLHNWLQDSYPKATATGAVIMSAFTTKLAIYALARGFPGEEILIYIGVTMTLFPVFFAVIENDLRRVLAYSLNNQLGFMVVGVGVGTDLAIAGAAAHAFCHILYKALLFMSMGAVLHRVGTCKASELGGLYRTMPLTAIFCMIGAASISAFPLFSGFVSKSLILSAVAQEHYYWVWAGLVVASAGVMENSGIKIPYFAFFSHDSGRRPPEAPFNMLIAMTIAASFCIGLGVWPNFLYNILPFDVLYEPYTRDHVLEQMQLLVAAMAAFALLKVSGLYPGERRREILDTDWSYRVAGPMLVGGSANLAFGAFNRLVSTMGEAWSGWRRAQQRVVMRPATGGGMAIWTAVLLGVSLVIAFLAAS